LPDTGGEVFLLEGTYNVEVNLALDSYQTLRGCGQNTILTTTTASVDIITATGGDGSEKVGILIADLCVDGSVGGALFNDLGILWTYVDYSTISNVRVLDNHEEGIKLDLCDFNRVVGNHVSGSTNDNIMLNDSYKNIVVSNISEGSGCCGIDIFGGIVIGTSNYNTVVGNIIQDNWEGIMIAYAEDCIISDNVIRANDSNGISISLGYRNTITGNIIQGNTASGIYAWSEAFDCAISDNVIQLNGHHGIYLCGGYNNVTGNLFLENSQTTDNTYDNIFVEDSSYNLISGNICRQGGETNKPRYGINISNDGCDRNCLIGNDLYDSGKTGDLNDVPTTNPTLKHDNRDLAGTGWLPEV